jgi:hypothetical protein
MPGKVVALALIAGFFTMVMRARAVETKTERRVSVFHVMPPAALYALSAWACAAGLLQILGPGEIGWGLAEIASGALLLRVARRRHTAKPL